MSIGLSLLNAIVTVKSKKAFGETNENWFTEEELPAYDFVRNHLRQYGTLPDNKTLKENSVTLTAAKQPVNYYVDRIQKRAVFNAIKEKHQDLLDALKTKDTDTAIHTISTMLADARGIANVKDNSTLVEESKTVEDRYYAAKGHSGIQGITLGFAPLDEYTDGAHGGDLIIYAGRPNIGKSYKLLKSIHAAWNSGKVALCVSMEMSSTSMASRVIAMESGINPSFIRKGQLSSIKGEDTFLETIDAIQNMPPMHFLKGNFSKDVGDVDSAIQELCPDIVYIDAAYELKPEGGSKNKAKWERIAEAMNGLKTVAQNRNVPIVATVQISRDGAKKKKRLPPDLSQVAGADAIVQVADVVVMMIEGLPPKGKITRQAFVKKNREGENDVDYHFHFNFSPMNFDYIGGTASNASFEDTVEEEAIEEDTELEQEGYVL